MGLTRSYFEQMINLKITQLSYVIEVSMDGIDEEKLSEIKRGSSFNDFLNNGTEVLAINIFR